MQQQDVREAAITRLHNTLEFQQREFLAHGLDTLAIDEQLLVTIRNGEVSVVPYVPPEPIIQYVEVSAQTVDAPAELVSEPAPEEFPLDGDALMAESPFEVSNPDIPVVSRSRKRAV